MRKDYQELIDSLTPEDIVNIMRKLGVDAAEETDKHLVFPTVCHNEDENAASHKLYYYKNNHFFYCYTECGGMSVFNFLKSFYEVRGIEYDWYQDVYKLVEDNTKYSNDFNFSRKNHINLRERYQERGNPILQEYSSTILESFIKFYPPEWLSDGITRAAMDKHNILYSISQNKIIIPHYDVDGRLVGVRGRALNELEIENLGKYMPVCIENVWYTHPLGLNLYGLDKTKNAIRENGYVYLFEAEKSVLQMENFSQPNCAVAVCGSNFSQFQLNILLRTCKPKEIIVCFDSEEEFGQSIYFDKLMKLCKKYKNYCNFSFVYDRKKLLEHKDSPTDKGEEIFNELIDRRIHVK